MPKYRVTFQVNCDKEVEVTANTEEEAKIVALEQVEDPCLCHQCARELDFSSIGEVLSVCEA